MLALVTSTFGRRAVVPSARVLVPTCARTLISMREFSSPKKHVVVNAVGIDRPGIVADVTRIVTSNGGNVGESRAQLLGGHFSLMMLVDIPESGIAGMQKQLKSDVGGLNVGCFDAIDPKLADASPKIGCK